MKKIKSYIKSYKKVFFLVPTFMLGIIFWSVVFAESPLAPTDLSLDGEPSASSVSIKWVDNATTEDKYNIERYVSSSTTSTYSILIAADSNSYVDNDVLPGYVYNYKVRACLTNNGCSDPAIIAGVVIPSESNNTNENTAPEVPATPSGLVAENMSTSGSASVSLSWSDNSNNENQFVIERKSNSSTPPISYYVGTDITSFIDMYVTQGSIYYYRIKACTSYGAVTDYCSSYSNIVSITIPIYQTEERTSTNVLPTTSPSYVSNITSSSSTNTSSVINTIPISPSSLKLVDKTNTSITINWIDNSNNEDKFNVERKLSGSTTWSTLTQITTPDTTAYLDSSVDSGVSYDYRVQACLSGVGCSEYTYLEKVSIPLLVSPELKNVVIPLPTTIIPSTPAAPSSLKINTVTSNYVSFGWIDNSINESGFNIERKLSSAIMYMFLDQIKEPNKTLYYDNNVNPGSSYDYRIQSCTWGAGCSEYTYLYRVLVPSTNITEIPKTIDSVTPNPVYKKEDVSIIPSTTRDQNVIINTNEQNSLTPKTTDSVLSKTTIPVTVVTTESKKIEDLNETIVEARNVTNTTKDQLIKLINENVDLILKDIDSKGEKIDVAKINNTRNEVIVQINKTFSGDTIPLVSDINNLKDYIYKKIEEIKLSTKTLINKNIDTENIIKEVDSLSLPLSLKSEELEKQGGDLLYKDTNKDGISDYESINIYKIDPEKPSPTSLYEGKEINASEKILLGFDPSKKELEKIQKEEPVLSKAGTTSSYKIEEVKLIEDKSIFLKGKALPNSFITLYIYSTPIMVTIKTDKDGEWQYVLDKELENGEHTVYTATVNNTGNIVAKSSGYIFTKTAEAITLQDLPISNVVESNNEPGLLSGVNIYIIILGFCFLLVIVMIIVGVISRKSITHENLPGSLN